MIENFEEITENLNDEELNKVSNMIAVIKVSLPENVFIKSQKLIETINFHLAGYYRINQVTLRKWMHHIRAHGLLPIVATSNGYCLTKDSKIIESQIRSLRQRANSIMEAAKGLHVFVKP